MTNYCPKCGSKYVNSGYIGPGEREYWCMSCGHTRHYPFSTKPPKRPKIKAKTWEEIQRDRYKGVLEQK